MKTEQNAPKGKSNKNVENKDNLDSRHKEEELVKENHITSNEKVKRSKAK